MPMTKLISLAYTPAELKAQQKRNAAPSTSPGDQPKYPYGFSLRLENDIIKKLGFDTNRKIGAKFTLRCIVEVVDKGERITVSGTKRNMELQIIAVAVEDGKSDRKRGAPSYPKEANEYLSRDSK
jgi:Major coat protein-like